MTALGAVGVTVFVIGLVVALVAIAISLNDE
jgi:hypothetical protein